MSTPTKNELPEWVADAIRDLPPILTKRDAAAFLRVSPRTLDRLLDSGRLTRMKVLPSASARCMIPRRAVADFLVRAEAS